MHHPDTIPEAALRACPGYRIVDAEEPVARSAQLVARLSAARAGKKPRRCITPTPSRRRRCAPVRATGSQMPGNL
ncbi:hypothetical protein NUBL21980_14870 [Klebsiella michiganensis]|nr:hypothetical protein NUBL21980_14870 [Klebsiella michiganensis]